MKGNKETKLFEAEPKTYLPDEDVRDFILKVYSDYQDDYELREEPIELLGGRTLEKFWEDGEKDYGLLIDDIDPNDPVTPYSSNVSRDKSNTFITNLTLQVIYPSVTAQNNNQEIDGVVSRVARSLLEWAYDNDGRPAENGHQKAVRGTHKQVVQGTVHIQDDIIDGQLYSQVVPNEQIFIPNFWQPNIQLQSHILRVQDDITYEEARRLFGHRDEFKYVEPGAYQDFLKDNNDLKSWLEGQIEENKCQIIYIQYDIPKSKFKKYGIPKNRKRAKLFNVIINGVLMYPPKNTSRYKDGYYNINKGIFEHFAKSEFYWGNSAPNKMKDDKKWLDGWKTLIRHKAKLGAIPPLITFNGQLIDQDIFNPGATTQAPAKMQKDDIIAIPGLANGVTNSDIAIMNEAKKEIDEGNISPQGAGESATSKQTASEAIIRERNEQKILGGFGLQVAFLAEARAYPIIRRLFQFLPKQTIKKIAVPNQNIGGGMIGDMEVIFEKPKETKAENKLKESFKIKKEETRARNNGTPRKKVYVNPEYLENINLYLKAVADAKPKETTAMREARAEKKFSIYSSRPDLFNAKASAKQFIKDMGDDQIELLQADVEDIMQTVPSQPRKEQGNQNNNKNRKEPKFSGIPPANKNLKDEI